MKTATDRRITRAALLLAAILMFTMLLAACNGNGTGDDQPDESTEPPAEPIKLSEGGQSSYKIIRPSDCSGEVLETFKSLMRFFNNDLECGMEPSDDWLMPNTDPASIPEILFGCVDRDESREAYAETPRDGYLIKHIGNKIVIAAHTEEQLAMAAEHVKKMVERREDGSVYMSAESVLTGGKSNTEYLFSGEGAASLADYKIVYSNVAKNTQAQKLARAIKRAYGIDLPVVDDNEPVGEYEFVLGFTNRSKSGDFDGFRGLYEYAGYRVFIRDKSIYILYGDSSTMATYAIDSFVDEYITPSLSPTFDIAKDTHKDQLAGMSPSPTLIDGANARIMSFNILSEEWDSAAVMDGRDYKVAATLTYYSPDVAGVQEVSEKWYQRLEALIGSEYEFVGKTIPSGQYNYTGLIYNKNKAKLIESGLTVYSVGNSPRLRLLNWGLFESKSNGERYIVCNTHYDANHTGDHTHIRVQQATEMAELVNKLAADYGVPIFCCGDYNCDEQSLPFGTFMKATGFIDPKYKAQKIDNPVKTYHKLGTGASTSAAVGIDHIACSPNANVLYYNTLIGDYWTNASDHLPIYIDIYLGTTVAE